MNYLSQSKHPLIKFKGHEKIGNDHHLRRLSIVKQILLVSSIRNVQRTVWRICILMLGCKGLRQTFALNVISACSVTASFSLDIALSAHFVFIYNSQQTFILWRLYLAILIAKRRNVQYIGYKYVISNGRGCSFLICALIGSLGCLPFFLLADDTTWFWCYDIQSKSALKRSLFPVCSENEMVANYLTKRKQ